MRKLICRTWCHIYIYTCQANIIYWIFGNLSQCILPAISTFHRRFCVRLVGHKLFQAWDFCWEGTSRNHTSLRIGASTFETFQQVQVIYIDVSKNSGFSPQIIHGLIGFSIIFTIHLGGNAPIFGNIHILNPFLTWDTKGLEWLEMKQRKAFFFNIQRNFVAVEVLECELWR